MTPEFPTDLRAAMIDAEVSQKKHDEDKTIERATGKPATEPGKPKTEGADMEKAKEEPDPHKREK